MLELFQNFERAAVRFMPVVLIGPGVVCIIAGLFVWLAGLRFRRVLVGVLGAAVGSILGFFVIVPAKISIVPEVAQHKAEVKRQKYNLPVMKITTSTAIIAHLYSGICEQACFILSLTAII